MQGIAKAFTEGGLWMYLIIIPLVFALGIIIERFIFLFFKYNINGNAFMQQIMKLVMANNIDRAIKLCNAAPSAALPRVIKAGLTKANKSEMDISNAIEEATLEEIPKVQKRTIMLTQLGSIATLMGLLRTIIGLIQAFAALEQAQPEQKAALLARGIAIAMNTTAFGLITAIPCMAAYLFYAAITKKITDDIELYSLKLENLLIARIRAGGQQMSA
jgi:biopolymer transport protein ExbB/TolQ